MTIFTADEIQQRVQALRDGGQESGQSTPATPPLMAAGGEVALPSYRFVRPLDDAADALVDAFTNTSKRFKFGMQALDIRMRGIGRGELAYITGFAHSGKTQLALQALVNQRDQAVLWVSPDETREQVLAKLVSMLTGVNGADIERRVKLGDRQTIADVKRVAHGDLANLIVIDEVLSLDDMSVAVKEAEQYFGREVALVGVDYLGLLAKGAEYGDMASSSKAVKRFTKQVDRPVLVIHQGSRGGAAKGKELTLTSMSYAGEAEANFVVGVRRKWFDDSLSALERMQYENTITVALLKNKRVSGGLGGEIDLHLDLESGSVTELHVQDLPPTPAPWTQDEIDF